MRPSTLKTEIFFEKFNGSISAYRVFYLPIFRRIERGWNTPPLNCTVIFIHQTALSCFIGERRNSWEKNRVSCPMPVYSGIDHICMPCRFVKFRFTLNIKSILQIIDFITTWCIKLGLTATRNATINLKGNALEKFR